jgi:uncharacterized protein (TIGR04255 family)
MTSLDSQPLPDYENPPVIEVVLSAQFSPLEGFQAPHLGLFWQRIRDQYPKAETAAPLAHVIEKSELTALSETMQVDVLSMPPLPRVLFVDSSNNWLVQFQSDHLVQNWRRTSPEEPYPHFPALMERFSHAWKTLHEFCEAERIAPPHVNQLEVTYINHIPVAEGWNHPKDLGQVFVDFGWNAHARFLPEPEAVAWKMAFVLPEKQGRLHISVRQAVRRDDNRPVLLCELTARGMPSDRTDDAIRTWLLLGREWIVRGFADVMSREIQEQLWKRTV